MKQIITLLGSFFIFYVTANGQIAKKNWLLGGNMSFSSSKYYNYIGNYSYTVFRIAGNAGYFIKDKFAVGLKPNIYFDHAQNTASDTRSSSISIGPFLRYYALPKEVRTNLFFEGSYAYGTNGLTNQNTSHLKSYSFLTGPVFFLNNSVGLELSVGYTYTKSNDPGNNKTNIFQVGFGFQFYLEKE